MNPPFHRSYWAIPGELIAGCYPGDLDASKRDQKLQALVDANVSLCVNLMEETEIDHSGNPFEEYAPRLAELAAVAGKFVQMKRFPIRDQSIPTIAQMSDILKAMEQELAAGGIIYVHCWGGKGRTATAVGCHLLSQGLETPATILTRLRELTSHANKFFWPTPQTEEQCAFILNWRARHA